VIAVAEARARTFLIERHLGGRDRGREHDGERERDDTAATRKRASDAPDGIGAESRRSRS
jgi:hypothetical protein